MISHPILEKLPGLLNRGGSQYCLCRNSREPTDLNFWKELWKAPEAPPLLRILLEPLKDSGPLQALGDYLVRKMGEKSPQDRERLIKAGHPYYLHVPLLTAWFSGGSPRRMDDLFRSAAELSEEQRIFHRTLGRILGLLDPGAVFILENMEKAGNGLLNFLKDNWEQADSPAILGLMNRNLDGAMQTHSEKVHPWYELLEESDRILLVPLDITTAPAPPLPAGKVFEGISRLTLGRSLFQWEDAQHWSEDERLFPESTLDRKSIDILLGHPESAWEDIRNNKENWVPPWFSPLLLAKMSSYPQALSRLQALEEHWAHLTPDEKMGTILTLLTFRDRMWLDARERNTLLGRIAQIKGTTLLSDATLWKSSLNYLLGLREDRGWDEAVKEGESLAEEFRIKGNMVALAKALHMLGYLYEDRSVDQAQEYYRQGLGLRMNFAHPLERVKTLNASGYYAFRMGEFLPALKFFKEALEVLEKVKDFTEICLTIFNIGLIYLINFETAAALRSYSMVLKVLKELQMPQLPFHGLREILALTGICAFHQGRFSHCFQLERQFDAAPEDPSGTAFQRLFRFHLACIQGDETLAMKCWDEAWAAASELQETFIRGHLCLEKYLWLVKSGRPAEAREALTMGYRGQGRYGPSEQNRLMEHLAMGRDRKDYQPLGIQSEQMEPLFTKLDLDLALVRLKGELETARRRVSYLESVCITA